MERKLIDHLTYCNHITTKFNHVLRQCLSELTFEIRTRVQRSEVENSSLQNTIEYKLNEWILLIWSDRNQLWKSNIAYKLSGT